MTSGALSKLRLLALVLRVSAKSAPLWLPSVLDFGAFQSPHEEGGSGGDSRSTRRDPRISTMQARRSGCPSSRRKDLGSNPAIGGGVAMRHAKSDDVDRPIGAVTLSRREWTLAQRTANPSGAFCFAFASRPTKRSICGCSSRSAAGWARRRSRKAPLTPGPSPARGEGRKTEKPLAGVEKREYLRCDDFRRLL